MNLSNIAIVMPTKNRSALFTRAVNFYAKWGFGSRLYVIDGSNEEEAEKNKQALFVLPNAIYYYDPHSVHEVASMMALKEEIKEDYVTFAGDDDFLLPFGLLQCIEFLHSNMDYDACYGVRFVFEDKGNYLKVTEASRGNDWDYDNPIKRFYAYAITGNSTNYAVHRRWLWKKILDHEVIKPRYIGTEFNMCAATVILSRIKRLDRIHILQQNNGFTWPHPLCDTGDDPLPFFQLIHSPGWPEGVNKLRDHLVRLLMETEHLTESEAKRVFNIGFTFRVHTMLENHFLIKYGKEFVPIYQKFIAGTNAIQNSEFRINVHEIEFMESELGMDVSILSRRTE